MIFADIEKYKETPKVPAEIIDQLNDCIHASVFISEDDYKLPKKTK